ncbi:hypothetical protein P170DRAFT_481297 [Aspergillus steynii IBT 23096]|uniref:MACPF-like domain-containing protein n=1 Tax=Aspergillus steynii IBT 23096 TaxID=1392250 RepID=A0A2I2FRT8_9EURO|nr:uncharacterized protein P170DRAFT_481297 [Aspergillus steynii IBT 23096]PLB43350.1 hypothetical protein P170DRAFT_481297 [Aspergillus steynii IBT 23096]
MSSTSASELKSKAAALKEKANEAGKANQNQTQAVFQIYNYDPLSRTSSMEKFVSLGSVGNLTGKKLADLRKMLISEEVLSYRQQGSPFCNTEGAEAKEDTPLSVYLKGAGNKLETSEPKTEENPKTDTTTTTGDNVLTQDTQTLSVYLKLKSLKTELDTGTQEFLKAKLDLDLPKAPALPTTKAEAIASTYAHSSFMAQKGGATVYPSDMTERHWNIVFRNNCLLHGSRTSMYEVSINKKVERAVYPANASHSPFDSYVEMSETSKSVAKAMADSSMTEYAAEVAIGGGAFGVSAAVKGGYSSNSSDSKATQNDTQTKVLTITYNFPRVVIHLDESSLELTEECKADINTLGHKMSLTDFNEKYGHYFATRIELGGRLHSSEDCTKLQDSERTEKAKSMKAAASLSFSSPWVQASASANYGSASNNMTENKTSSMNMTMTWEAKGGDTLLCNNPPAWCSTVASYYNWRVVKQESLIPVTDMIMNLSGGSILKAKIDAIKNPPGPTDKTSEGKTDADKTGTSHETSLPVKPETHVQAGKTEKPVAPVKPDATSQPNKTGKVLPPVKPETVQSGKASTVSPVKSETSKPAVTEKTGTTAPPKVHTVKSKVSVSLNAGSRYLAATNEMGMALGVLMHDLDGSNGAFTPAQLKFINDIDTGSMLTSNCSLVNNASDQKFEIEVEHNSNEKPLLKRNVTYRVLSKNAGKWLTSSSTLPGFYDKSAIYLRESNQGTDQLATFAFDSLRHRSVSAIEDGDLAFIRMFDSSGRSLGGLTDISSNNGKLSGAIGTKGTSDKLTFAVKYV